MNVFRTMLVFGFLFGGALSLRLSRVDDDYHRRRRETDVRDLIRSPGINQLRAVSLQHPLAIAELFWLSAVQEIGRFVEAKQPRVTRLKNWASLATDLDPRYHQVYKAVAINLIVYNRDPDGAEKLLEKGRKHLPNEWQYPFLMGYAEYFLRGDLRRASERWTEAAYLPGVPRFVPSLAARSRFQAGDEQQAEALLRTMIDALEGPHRTDAEIRLKLLHSEKILRAYDKACTAFFERNGFKANSAAELRMAGLVDKPPEDLFGNPITLDTNCRARTKMVSVREDEAVRRAGSQRKQPQSVSDTKKESPAPQAEGQDKLGL